MGAENKFIQIFGGVLLNREMGWKVGERNVGQQGFFFKIGTIIACFCADGNDLVKWECFHNKEEKG